MATASSSVKAGCGKCLPAPSFAAMGSEDEERRKRLAEALRQNLRRRKAQARGEAEKPPEGPREG